MVLLYNSRGSRTPLRFSFPDTGGASGGNPSGAADGNANGNGGATIVTPFDSLPWDELDDESRKSLEKGKADYLATLQEQQKTKADLEKQILQARGFQSEKDRLQAELDKLTKRQEEPDPYNEALTEELRKAGYDDKQAATLAPVFAGMFKRIGVIQKQEIGRDLAPMGQTVLAQEAQGAFQHAVQNDPTGVFQTPEVQQKVWDFVVERTKAGHQTSPEIVANLGAMAWVEHATVQRNAGKEVALPTPPVRTQPAGGGGVTPQFTFPGASLVPTFNPPTDANAAKTQLDGDTLAALASTFKSMGGDTGIYPKSLKSHILTPRRGR
jgi:hypothetical protein